MSSGGQFMIQFLWRRNLLAAKGVLGIMKALVLCVLAMCCHAQLCFSQRNSIDEVRELFYDCTLNSAHTPKLLALLESLPDKTPTLCAYEGATQAIHTKNLWNPFGKIAHVKKALISINIAVEADPENMEIRFLRFAVEFHIPDWLKSEPHDAVDATFLYDKLRMCDLSQFSPDILKYIQQFYMDNPIYSAEQTKEILARLDTYILAFNE